MLQSIFATKKGMTQVWDTAGKRWPVTRCMVNPNMVVGVEATENQTEETTQHAAKQYFIAYGNKKLKNMSKPLRTKLIKGGFSLGATQIKGIKPSATAETEAKVGDTVSLADVLKVGDVVKVQGTSKGRGFAGAMKRHGFHGGPKTHGQSDRSRAVGSIGAGTTPGKVLKGKRMPGHYGVETHTVQNLVVLHCDSQSGEVLISGPVPGHLHGVVRITPVGVQKNIELDLVASNLTSTAAEKEENTPAEATNETESTTE